MSRAIEVETLGQKHKMFNILVMKAVKEKTAINYCINYEDTDMDNLLRVDVACHTRNLDFILTVLKCQDILFICRAIKSCTWLIEPKYAHIVNPVFLYTQLFPDMITEARNRLLQHIRLNLNDTTRSEDFFNYLEKIDIDSAMKWFPKCSIPFILSRLQYYIHLLPEHIIYRLFSVNFEVFKIYCDVFKKNLKLEMALFLIKLNGEEFFDILDRISEENLPNINKKYTKLSMKVCPHRLMFNFDHYQNHIDIQCFIKYIDIERIEEFHSKYSSNEKLQSCFQNGIKNIQKLRKDDSILLDLSNCDNEDDIKNILTRFKDNLCQFHGDLIFKFINKFISKFNLHRLDSITWEMYNDVFKEIINSTQYSINNITVELFIHSTVFYHIIHNKVIPEDVMIKFRFNCSMKTSQKKLCKGEIDIVFDYLLNFCLKQLHETQKKVYWIENMFVLLKVWRKSIKDCTLFQVEVIKAIKELQSECDYDSLNNLYNKKKFWRKYLLNECLVIKPHTSSTFMNLLKHKPGLLYPLEDNTIMSENKQAAVFYRKLRTYWPNSLGKQYKDFFYAILHNTPSLGLYILLSKREYENVIQCYAPMNKLKYPNEISKWINYKVEINIARNIYKIHPNLGIEAALLYLKGFPMIHALSSINAILYAMSKNQMRESLENLDTWPEIVQKLCIYVIYSQPLYDKLPFLLTIWENTKYSSVRAEIFKKSVRSMCVYKNVIRYPIIQKEWNFLQTLMDTLHSNESMIVDNLPLMFQKLSRMHASDFCLKSYEIMKSLPSPCKIFPRKSLLHYFAGGLHLVNTDIIAAMVNDIVTERLWTARLNNSHIDNVASCLYTWKNDKEQIVSFQKVIAPIFEKAYEIWDTKTHNYQLVRFNMTNIITCISRRYETAVDYKSNFLPSVLKLLLDSLESNLSVKQNYTVIRNLKLAVEYFKILSKFKFNDTSDIFDETSFPFAEMCLKMFCDDIALYGKSVWKLFYHALQQMLDRFYVSKHIQYKIYGSMLDLSTELSPELNFLVHVLIFELTLYKNDDFISFLLGDDADSEDEEGQQKLLTRIKAHKSHKVKACQSKNVLTHVCDVYYQELKYM